MIDCPLRCGYTLILSPTMSIIETRTLDESGLSITTEEVGISVSFGRMMRLWWCPFCETTFSDAFVAALSPTFPDEPSSTQASS